MHRTPFPNRKIEQLFYVLSNKTLKMSSDRRVFIDQHQTEYTSYEEILWLIDNGYMKKLPFNRETPWDLTYKFVAI